MAISVMSAKTTAAAIASRSARKRFQAWRQ
jgi:hypothetical protein